MNRNCYESKVKLSFGRLHPLGGKNRARSCALVLVRRRSLRLLAPSLFRIFLQHAQRSRGTSGRILDWSIESVQQLHNLWSNFDHILYLGQGPLSSSCLYLAQLYREVANINRIHYGEEELSVDVRVLIVLGEIGKIAENLRLLYTVGEHFIQGQLLVPWNSHLADFLVFEHLLAAIQNPAQVLHRAVALLWQIQLTYKQIY